MSIESWKEEFYPTHVDQCSKEDAVAHSLRKWRGLIRENMIKHGVEWWGSGHIEDTSGRRLAVDGETCALCHHYATYEEVFENPCHKCPLYIVRGGVSCADERDDEGITGECSPWSYRRTEPERMVMWLERTAQYEKGELQPIANCAPEGFVPDKKINLNDRPKN